MQLRSKRGLSLIGLLVVGFLALGVAAPASAATIYDPLDVSDIRHLDFQPSKSASAWKTTVPASVLRQTMKNASSRLGGSSPSALSDASRNRNGAALASSFRQTRAGAALSSTMLPGESVKNWVAREQANPSNPRSAAAMASIKTKFTVPATPLAKLGKVASGANQAGFMLGGVWAGFQVGKGVSNMFGGNAADSLCAPTFQDNGMVALLTGTDCTEYFQLHPDYEPNMDAGSGGTMTAVYCSTVRENMCMQVLGTNINSESRYITDGEAVCLVMSNYGGSSASSGQPGLTSGGLPIQTYRTVSDSTNGCMGYDLPSGFQRSQMFSSTTYYREQVMTYADGICFQYRNACTSDPEPIDTVSADPTRQFECIITGTNGVEYRAMSEEFTEGSGLASQPVCPALPDEVTAENIKVEETGPDGPAEVFNEDTTDAYKALSQNFPECATGLCFADLRKVQTDGTTSSCFDDLDESACLDWYADPLKTDAYVCEYGGIVVALDECTHYASTFNPSKRSSGQAYSDPETGAQTPQGSAPADAGAFANSVQDPSSDRNCFPTGWGMANPVSWVVQPVQCALEWAFVPREAVVIDAASQMQSAWSGTAPGQMFVAVAAWDVEFDISGCDGLAFPFQYREVIQDIGIPSACPGQPLAPFAGVMYFTGTIVFLVTAAMSIRRQAGSSIGYNA